MDSRQLYVGRQAGRQGRRALRHLFAVSLLAAYGGLTPLAAWAAPADEAVVEQVQWPAWVETGGKKGPLAPGQVLQADQQVMTGERARLVIRLADGSAVKLGEQAQLRIASLKEREPGVLSASLELARGAFRYTTGLFRKVLGQRQLEVRFPTLTIGVRGTDFWGKSAPGSEMVLLLEGAVALTRHGSGAAPVEERKMVAPLSYLVSERESALQERQASAAEIAVWAAETEPDVQLPLGRAAGKEVATIAGGLSRSRAEAATTTLRDMGYPVAMKRTAAGAEGRSSRYAVILPKLGNAEEAQAIRQQLRRVLIERGVLSR